MKTNHHDHCIYVEALNMLNDPFAETSPHGGMQNHSMAVEDNTRVSFPVYSEYPPVVPKGIMDNAYELGRENTCGPTIGK